MRKILAFLFVAECTALLLTGCETASLHAAPQWQLAERVLPDMKGDATKQMHFSPDGSKILIRGTRSVAVVSSSTYQPVTFIEAKGSRFGLGQFLDNGAIAFDNAPTPELLLPDLTRSPLPSATQVISNDGHFVFIPKLNSEELDSIQETKSGRVACNFPNVTNTQRIFFNSRYATIGTSAGLAICDLAHGKLTWLKDEETFDRAAGWMDPQGHWLLVLWYRTTLFGTNETRASLYSLPLVPKYVPDRETEPNEIPVEPIKRWDRKAFRSAAFSPDGRWLVMASDLKVELRRLDALDNPIAVDTHFVSSKLAFSRDSRWLTFQGESDVYLGELKPTSKFSKMKTPRPLHSFTLYDVAPDGSALLATVRESKAGREQNVIWKILPSGSTK